MTGRFWAYVGTALGGTASVAANVAHSFLPPAGAPPSWTPEVGAVISAVFWPVALYVIVEILVQNRWPAGNGWMAGRFVLLVPVALVAFVVSYRHLSGLLDHYGEDPLTVTIGPLAVDGLMVMAAAALFASTSPRHQPATAAAPLAVVDQVPASAPVVNQVSVPEPVAPPAVASPPSVAARANGAIPSGVVR